jgi:hypothetical protein
MLRHLGTAAELSFTFRRGNKIVTTYECDLSVLSNGSVEVMCSELIALEVTMYKENETKYLVHNSKLANAKYITMYNNKSFVIHSRKRKVN